MSERIGVLAAPVDPVTLDEAAARVIGWARAGESRMICAANVHMVMEAVDHPDFARMLADADLVTPDGMPLAWFLRARGRRGQPRVSGPDLTEELLARAERAGLPVGFHGSTPAVIEALRAALAVRHPGLKIAHAESPPFRPLDDAEAAREAGVIAASGARLLFVGLGCPKQEAWMHRNRGRIPAAMVGVGAAFEFLAGARRRAPAALRRLGLEWLWRLAAEPRRLFARYARHNGRFAVRATAALLRGR